MTDFDYELILNTPMAKNDAGAETIRGYLLRITQEVWRYGEGFSGKRPFGNSGWDWEIFEALAEAGIIEATYDDDGNIDFLADEKLARRVIAEAIAWWVAA